MRIQNLYVVVAATILLAACTPKSGSNEAVSIDSLSPKTKLIQGRHHKVLIDKSQREIVDRMERDRSIVQRIEYGSFWVLVHDREQIEGLARIDDDQNLIRIDGYEIDAVDPDATYSRLPARLAKDHLGRALAQGSAPAAGLYLIQAIAPMQDDWRAQLEARGLELVQYVPENAFVVRANARIAAELPRIFRDLDFVQFAGDYEPAFKISPELRELKAGNNIDVTVQVIKNGDLKSTMRRLAELGTVIGEYESGEYQNVVVNIDTGRVEPIALLDDVFAVEYRPEKQLLDEAQGQILAGNLTGGSPTGPGYLDFLTSKGFNSSQFQGFVVNVVDDSHAVTGHADLPASRVAFQNNPTSAGGSQGGHGFLNTHIVGGFNSSTGTAFEDTSGFNYGLGIAPYARVGVTDIFGVGFSTPTSWENTAHSSGARISTNSWGFIALYDYDSNAQEYDRLVRDARTAVAGQQQLVVVFAAGNDGSGSNTVASPSTAKNVITVGASENVRQTGTDGCLVPNSEANDARDMVGFSSRGPVNPAGGDGRIKPDIVGPGTHIQAGVPQSNYNGSSVCNQYWPAGQTLYGWSSGTSHSCPAVAGGAALVYQDFLNRALPEPSPAMVKAYLMNSATYMTGTGANDNLPSNSQGMGRMDLGRAFDGTARMLVDQTVVLGASGNTHDVTGTIANSTLPFRVTLVWTDVQGPTTGAPWVNNLDLRVTVGGTTYLGNVFTGANSSAGGAADTRNNAESVFLPAGTSGAFTVTVNATAIAGDGVPGNADTTDQDFALVIYNGTGTALPPTIGVSPASMSFSGTAGGANPANQTLSISNTGGGTLNWTASSNASWLSISPASGTAPSSGTVSVSTAGLAAGTYNGAITVSATGATNSPVTVPVTLTVNPPAAPTIGASPTSMSFSGTAGGANPANQTLTISNTGGGTLSWTGTTNQSWLTISPTSGTAPTSVTVSTNTSGLAVGTYNGTITITSAGATNSPLSVPVTLTVNAAGTEYLANGGFEVAQAPWLRSGPGMFYTANGSSPHGGTGYAYCGTLNSTNGSMGQQFSIPAGATSANLTYWLKIETNETTTTAQNDMFFMEIRNTSGALLVRTATFSNLNAAAYSSYAQPASFSLLPYAGQTIRIGFRCQTSTSLTTTFYVDDVSVR